MAIGTTNLAATPCCGVIQRTWEAIPDEDSETGMTHTPGSYNRGSQITLGRGPYAPTFTRERMYLDRGICPDCGKSFVDWLRENGRETRDGWQWDYGTAERAYADRG